MHIISLHGKTWTQQIDVAPKVWLQSSVGRASHRYRGGHGFEFYHSECKNCCLYIIIQKIALKAESETCFQIWFFPRFGGKKWRNFEHAHASYPGLFFSPTWVQPLYGAGRKESSGIGLVEALIFFRLLPSNCLNWKFTAMITLHFLLTKVGYIEDKKIIIMVFIMYFYHNQFKDTLQLFKVAQYSFQHLYLDGSLQPLFITWCYNHGIKKLLN